MRIALGHINCVGEIKYFYSQYISKETRLVYSLILLMIFIGFTYMIINAFTMQYPGYDYVPRRWVILSPFILGVTLLAIAVQKSVPKLAKFTQAYGTFFFLALSFAILTTGVQLTPFHRVDDFLAKLDLSMGINTPVLMAWTARHPYIHKILEMGYDFLYLELIAVPLILPFFEGNKTVSHFFITMLLAFIIGTTIYYFFPTAAPASVFHSRYFMSGEHATFLKFYNIHHYHAVSSGDGGLIAFPSFHVAWAVILTCAVFRKKWLFIPLTMINILLIISTVLLGFHYLVDVFGGILLAALAILLVQMIHNKYFSTFNNVRVN